MPAGVYACMQRPGAKAATLDGMAQGRSVLVTRAAQQGSELAEQLRALGASPILVPAIQITEPSSFHALDRALAGIENFDWLIFTSANAASVFADRLRRKPAPLTSTSASAPLRVAAIGNTTRKALELAGLGVDLVPEQAVAESLAESLVAFARQTNGTPTRFLLIRAEEGRDVLPAALRAAGAEVVIAPAYRTVIPEGSVQTVRELFRDPALTPDAITFTSSSTARNLLALCEQAGVILPETALRASIGPVTSQTMSELRIPPHAQASEPSVESLAQTVIQLLQAR